MNKRKSVGKQRNCGANGNIAAGEGLELVRGTKGSQSDDKGNRGANENIAAGKGLELVRKQKEVNRTTKKSGAHNKTAAGGGLELVHGKKEVGRQRQPNEKQNSRWRRPGTSARKKGSRTTKATAAKNKTAAGEGLELVHAKEGSQSEDKGNRREYKRNPVARERAGSKRARSDL